ncbi:MAG: permease [Acutalibacteraceae bacterium]|nr:permease [Acutalibacteraceae bacterium]
MKLFGGVVSVSGITFLMFAVFVIAVLGYGLGRVNIKGVSLGTAGVFIVALLFGALFSKTLSGTVIQTVNGAAVDISGNALKIVENIGLILFVTSVGFIAGPSFFKDLKKNYKSYILLGIVIIFMGGLTCLSCYFVGRNFTDLSAKQFMAICVGLLSGALTSTPAFSASKATVAPEYEELVTVGNGIAYIFGVIGVVLFVQLIPKIVKADMEKEAKKLVVEAKAETVKVKKKCFEMDDFGLFAFGLAAVVGVFVGAIKIPMSSQGLSGTTFSLTTTGGALLTALVFGHFGQIGLLSLRVDNKTLKTFRELGLMLFLIGAGIAGGTKFVTYFKPVYFLYGALMTIVPMIVGFLFAKYVLKLSLLNNLGSITGGMTSTPALGTLINVAKTENIASAYAATYPIALIAVVLVSQFLIILF